MSTPFQMYIRKGRGTISVALALGIVTFAVTAVSIVLGSLIVLGLAIAGATPVRAEDAGAAMVRGIILAATRVDLQSDLGAPVSDVTVREGERFAAGDVLIRFDCRRLEADLKAAKAENHAAHVDLKQKRYLHNNGAGGRTDVDLAAASGAVTAARIEAVEARMADCEMKAPFDGRVAVRGIGPSELPAAGDVLMTLIEDRALEIELVVPSLRLRDLDVGSQFTFLVDETGTSHQARIERIGAEVDAVSQTVKLHAVFEDVSAKVLAGMSGNARFASDTDTSATGAVR